MKTIPPALQAHLAGGVTTLCYCWRVTRRDGTVLGFTEHDRDIVAEGTTFLGRPPASRPRRSSRGSGSRSTTSTRPARCPRPGLTDADILAGRYDDAAVEVFWVNWDDPTQAILLASGNLGEIQREGVAFSAELRSLAHRLDQKIGQTYERTCSATLGDARCEVDLAAARLSGRRHGGERDHVAPDRGAGPRRLRVRLVHGRHAHLRHRRQPAIAFEIKAHRRTAGVDILELWLPPPFPVAAGDRRPAVAGCRKTLAACMSKFDNVVNFRGFPHIPGVDVVTRYGVQGALGQTGGSIFGSS